MTFKIFEKLILHRLETHGFTEKLSDQQVGFQKGMSSMMASFVLRESIANCSEHASKLFVAFMDTRKAFDVVWHNGLFIKLKQFGIPLKTLQIIIELYNGR